MISDGKRNKKRMINILISKKSLIILTIMFQVLQYNSVHYRITLIVSYNDNIINLNLSDPVPVLMGSFFTYSDVDQDYWSGYFTSRIFDKALDRKLEHILYVAETLPSYTPEQVQEPRRALSLFQHHDSVTGTAKDHVVNDYAKRMHTSIRTVHEWILQQLSSSTIVSSVLQRQLVE